MKPPPFLLGATLAFWGWQSDFLIPGVLMGLIVESARFVHARWEFSDEDFSRVWTFCSLLFLAAGVYAFTTNQGPSSFGGLFSSPTLSAQRAAGTSSAKTAAAVFRWLPMIFFPFLATQLFSMRDAIPLTMISLILRRRWKKAKQAGKPAPAQRNVNIGYAYFAGTLLAASVHAAEGSTYFWGLALLLTWALWAQRSRRFTFAVWCAALAAAVALGFAGQRGLGQLQRYLGNFNPAWFAHFMRRNVDPRQSLTALGQVGEIKTSGRIVIRLEPKAGSPAPTYLREASYRVYGGFTWFAGSSKDDFQPVNEAPPNSGNWTLLDGRTNPHTVNIACYLEGMKGLSAAGLLPLPAGVGRMEKLPAYVLSYSSAGAVLAEGPGLVIFDALYGSGGTLDSPPGTGSTTNESPRPTMGRYGSYGRDDSPTLTIPPPRKAEHTNQDLRTPQHEEPTLDPVIADSKRRELIALRDRLLPRTSPPPRKAEHTNQDLRLPEREEPALDRVIADLQLHGLPRDEVLQKVRGYFAEKFTYRTWQPPGKLGTNETAVSRFLLKTRAGHCEYFATATTLLLRRLDLPARYAVGYAVHETSGRGYVVRLRDAHAWCLVWNDDKKLWDDFDTTPASWVAEEGKHASAFQWLQDAWTRLRFEFAKFRWGQSNVRKYLLIAIVPGLAVLLYQILFRRGRRRKKVGDAAPLEIFNWPGLDSDFYQLEKKLTERGVPRGASEPLNEWLERVAETPGLAELCAPLQEILRLHYRYRFDPLGLNEVDREVLRAETRACLEKLSNAEKAVAFGT